MSKERIIGHMNADHALALKDYLVVYANEDPQSISDEKIIDLDLESVTIQYSKGAKVTSHQLRWQDAQEDKNVDVSEWGHLKDKLVAMAHYAAEKQGFAAKQITTVKGPTGGSFGVFFLELIMLLNAINPSFVRNAFQKDPTFRLIASYLPGFLGTAYKFALEDHVLVTMVGMFSVHIVEILLFTVPFLRRYRVPEEQRVRWMLMHFFEGFHVILRLKGLK